MCKSDLVEVTWECGAHSTLPHLWLRDNCDCDDCRISQTSEKKFILSDVPPDLAPVEADVVDGCLRIVWPDGHQTIYDSKVLRTGGRSRSANWSPWPKQFVPERYAYQAFLDDDRVAAAAISLFMDQGALILSEAPDVPGTLEMLAPRLGPIREVLFDRIHNVKVDPAGYNVAHTPLPLPPHNDFASYTWPPSVQALHMLVNEAKGGKSFIVDGWSILSTLRDEEPNFFEVLCTMPVPFREFDSDNETYAEAPIVRLDARGRIDGLRFSNQLMQTIDPNDPDALEFYRAYHALCRRITDPRNRSVFRLDGGEILVVAAHRVLHGREAFEVTGPRHLQDAYFDLVFAHDAGNAELQADRVLGWLRQMEGDSPYQISRLDHCLQTATRAEKDGADDETITCALLHDIGDILAPANHSQVAAALLAPFISEKNHWIVKHHGLFQGYYWFEYAGRDPNARDRFKGHEHYEACADFCARWDQVSFDPNYVMQPLEHFEPLVRSLFAQDPKPYF